MFNYYFYEMRKSLQTNIPVDVKVAFIRSKDKSTDIVIKISLRKKAITKYSSKPTIIRYELFSDYRRTDLL